MASTLTVYGAIDNTGTISVNDSTLTASSIGNANGTLTVNDSTLTVGATNGETFTAGTIDNTNGTISLCVNSHVTSNITGGTITLTSPGGTSGLAASGLITVVSGTLDGVAIYISGSSVQAQDGDLVCTINNVDYYLSTLPNANGQKNGIYLTAQPRDTLYVSSIYDNVDPGTSTGDVIVDYTAYSAKVINEVAVEAKKIDAKIVVEEGTYGNIIELQGATTTIISNPVGAENPDVWDVSFSKAVYGGTKIEGTPSDATLAVVDDKEIHTKDETRSTEISVSGGSFNKFIVGGNNIKMSNQNDEYTVTAKTDPEDSSKKLPQTVTITEGVYKGIVAAGDRVQKGVFTLNSDLETTISGGTFTYCVAGGLLNSLYNGSSNDGEAAIHGNVSLTISGGIFASDPSSTRDCWIYGGNVATNKANGSLASSIEGNVVVTVECGSKDIELSNLVVGSYGRGAIDGDAILVFKGNGAKLNFVAGGELWGGCSGDTISANGESANSFVTGDRLLSFEGFTGSINPKTIRNFKSIQLISNDSNQSSVVTLTENSIDMSGVENWTFEEGSSLSGSFANNFEDDTLTLDLSNLGIVSSGWSWSFLENSKSGAFIGFGDLFENVEAAAEEAALNAEQYCAAHRLTVQVKTETTTQLGWNSDNKCYSGTIDNYSCTLALDSMETPTRMILTLA